MAAAGCRMPLLMLSKVFKGAHIMTAIPKSQHDNTVFVIDDDEIIRISCEQILTKSGYRVETFANGQAGIERLREVRPPLLVGC